MVQAFLFLGTVGCWPKCQTNSTWRICYWQNCWKSSLGPKKMLGTANIGCSVTSPGLGAYSVPCTPFAYWERKNFMQPNPWSGMQVSTQIHTHNLEVPNILLLNPLVMKQSDNSTAALRFLDSCFGFCLIQWFLASLTKRDRTTQQNVEKMDGKANYSSVRHQNRHQGIVKRLWFATPPYHRPVTSRLLRKSYSPPWAVPHAASWLG